MLLLLLPPTKSVLKQREVPSTVSSSYVSVLYTAMLRTSIAAVVLGCFYFCPLDCNASVMVVDCAAVQTGCMLEKYIPAEGCNKVLVHFYFFGRGVAVDYSLYIYEPYTWALSVVARR